MYPFYLQTTKVKASGANIKKTELGQPLKPNQWSVSQENHTQVTIEENNSRKKEIKNKGKKQRISSNNQITQEISLILKPRTLPTNGYQNPKGPLDAMTMGTTKALWRKQNKPKLRAKEPSFQTWIRAPETFDYLKQIKTGY